ncbi:NlpC/P60 family protein [Shewanella woodyi]|uniref:NlpC/P60 family protein n=1 Tax=Shewanella woodyi TaxID=60961 RepID=UPI0037478A0D
MRLQFLISALFLLSACSISGTDNKADTSTHTYVSEKQLLAFYKGWKGVPYRLGGMSKRGVDCSGFVYLAYQQLLTTQVISVFPRTTADQVELGRQVSKSQLKTGDLVFFKTGWSTRHVGIYLSDNRFLHASTSQGVMISRLDNSYWKQKYWQSRRLSFPT